MRKKVIDTVAKLIVTAITASVLLLVHYNAEACDNDELAFEFTQQNEQGE